MADTTLELKIISNASSAIKALTGLASAMERVRKAASVGLGLHVVVRDIRDLTKAVDESKANGTANYLIKLAEALEKISKVRGVKLPNLDDLTKGAGDPDAATNVNNMANALAKYENAVARVGRTIHQQTGPSAYAKQFVEASREMTRAEVIFDEAFARRFTYQEKLNSGERAALPAPGQMQVSPLNDWREYMENTINEVVNAYEMGALRIQQALMFSTQGMQNAYRVFSEDFAQRWTYIQMLNGQTGEQKQLPGGINWGPPIKNATGWGGSSGRPPALPPGPGGNGGSGGIDNGGFAQYEEDVREANVEVRNLTVSLNGLFKTIKNGVAATRPAGSQLIGMFRSIGRIAFNRIIRGAIMAISKAFKEGLENVKAYHKAIGSDLNDAMTQAANATFKMKNSLGAALAPMIRSLLPMLQMLVSWVITAANVMNQFFALLNGAATWTRATDAAADSLDKVKTSAGGAGSAVKNLLADWDELNIIQSQGGGGGGGGGNALGVDYETMFEEVEVFDKRIRNIVDFIRDNFDNILSAAKRIGAAILLWDVSKAFGGIVAWLGGIAAEGLVLSVVFSFTRMFDDKYLETGEPGWLIADWVTTGLGAVIGGKILKGLVDPKNAVVAANVAAIITLTVSALASIISYVTNVDNSALSKENLTLLLSGAGKIGLGAGLAAFQWLVPLSGGKTFGAKLWNSIAVGFAATLVTFGVAVGIKAFGRAVEGDLDVQTLERLAIASLTVGGGIGILGNRIWGTNWYRSVEAGVGSGLLLFSAGVGVQAVAEAVRNDELTMESLEKIAASSVGMSVGAALIANSLFKVSGADAAAGGAAGLFGTLGVMVGIQAVLRSVQNDEITEETIRQRAESSLLMGISAAIVGGKLLNLSGGQAIAGGISTAFTVLSVETAIMAVAQVADGGWTEASLNDAIKASIEMGLGAGTIALAAGGGFALAAGTALAAAAVMAVVLAVTASIADPSSDSFTWGTFSLTDEQVQEFVNTKMFNADVKATIGIISDKIELTAAEQKKIKEDLALYLGTQNVIKLGFATTDDYTAAHEYLDAIMTDMEDYIEKAKASGRMVLTYTPKLAGNSVAAQNDWYTGYDEGWKVVEDFYKKKGAALATLLTDEEARQLNTEKSKLLNSLMQQISDVTLAMSNAQIEANAYSTMGMGLGDLTKASFNDVITTFKDYGDELNTEYGKLIQQQYANQRALVAALEIIAPDSKELEEARNYLALMESVNPATGKTWTQETTEAYVSEAMEPGRKLIREWIGANATVTGQDMLRSANLFVEGYKEGLEYGEFTPGDTSVENLRKIAERVTGINAGIFEVLGTSGWEYIPTDVADTLIEGLFNPNEWADVMQTLMSNTSSGIGTLFDGVTITAPAPDTTDFDSGLNGMKKNARETVDSINNILAGTRANMTLNLGVFDHIYPKYQNKANGGFVTTGQMFIAREAGPEMVGSIGGRTAVANNDQIVAGIAGGVAAGQGEQNNLLRQQNEYLRMLLAKESTIKVEPSSGWGKFNRQSERMYAHNAGV